MYVHFTHTLELDWLSFKQINLYRLHLWTSLLHIKYCSQTITFLCGHYYTIFDPQGSSVLPITRWDWVDVHSWKGPMVGQTIRENGEINKGISQKDDCPIANNILLWWGAYNAIVEVEVSSSLNQPLTPSYLFVGHRILSLRDYLTSQQMMRALKLCTNPSKE